MGKTYTERGFANYAEFKDRYGADITVRQSSLATEDCVWIFTEGGTENNSGALHLNIEQATALVNALTEWVGDVTEAIENE